MASRLSYQNKIAISALLSLAAIFGLAYFVIIPAANNVESIKIQMENQSLEDEKNYTQGQNLKNLKDAIKTVEPRLNEIEQIFIKETSDDEVAFFTSLEMAAAKNNVTEKSTLGSAAPLGQSYSQIPLRLDVTGNFKGLIGFIYDLETHKNYININSLQITAFDSEFTSAHGTSTLEKSLKAAIDANTYWEK
jgi:Tfp pilus assembly protein PilO